VLSAPDLNHLRNWRDQYKKQLEEKKAEAKKRNYIGHSLDVLYWLHCQLLIFFAIFILIIHKLRCMYCSLGTSWESSYAGQLKEYFSIR